MSKGARKRLDFTIIIIKYIGELNLKRLTEQEIRLKTERNLKSHMEANKDKEILFKSGFWLTISFYAVVFNPLTDKNEYRRIEVFLNSYPTQEDVGGLHNFFMELPPIPYYTLWAYDVKSKQVILVEGWN